MASIVMLLIEMILQNGFSIDFDITDRTGRIVKFIWKQMLSKCFCLAVEHEERIDFRFCN